MKYLLLILLPILFSNNSYAKHIVYKHCIEKVDSIQKNTRAIIILNGLGDSRKGRRHQHQFFDTLNYDLFIPKYIKRKGFAETVISFKKYFYENKINEYKEVYIFAYIMGSWTINTFINENHPTNIKSIVYDRSPLQERAPKVLINEIPILSKLIVGKVLTDLSKMKYPKMLDKKINVGIIVENKATPLIHRFKEKTLSLGTIEWGKTNFNQEYMDKVYFYLNHDEMYYSFNIIGKDIIHFFEHAMFNKQSSRLFIKKDPFYLK